MLAAIVAKNPAAAEPVWKNIAPACCRRPRRSPSSEDSARDCRRHWLQIRSAESRVANHASDDEAGFQYSGGREDVRHGNVEVGQNWLSGRFVSPRQTAAERLMFSRRLVRVAGTQRMHRFFDQIDDPQNFHAPIRVLKHAVVQRLAAVVRGYDLDNQPLAECR